MIVLSIDPGYDRIGFAILQKKEGGIELLHSECFQTNRADELHIRQESVGSRMIELIDKFSPEQIAIEKIFFSKNKKTALLISEIRGMLIFIAKNKGISCFEYTPNQVKIGITGNGSADKKDMLRLLKSHIKLRDVEQDDEIDAISIGVVHLSSIQK